MKINQNLWHLLYRLLIFISLVLLTACTTNEKIGSFAPVEPPSQEAKAVVKEALELQGQPYVFGGESLKEGFDCSGLVFYVYKKQGLKLPRDTWSLANQLPSVQLHERLPGDLVFFTINTKPHSHVGIYVGEDKFIHAPSSRTGKVMMSDLNHPYWRERFSAVRRPKWFKSVSENDRSYAWW